MWGLNMCIRKSLTLHVGTWRKWGLTLSPHFDFSYIGSKWGPEAPDKVLHKSPKCRYMRGVHRTLHNLPAAVVLVFRRYTPSALWRSSPWPALSRSRSAALRPVSVKHVFSSLCLLNRLSRLSRLGLAAFDELFLGNHWEFYDKTKSTVTRKTTSTWGIFQIIFMSSSFWARVV